MKKTVESIFFFYRGATLRTPRICTYFVSNGAEVSCATGIHTGIIPNAGAGLHWVRLADVTC